MISETKELKTYCREYLSRTECNCKGILALSGRSTSNYDLVYNPWDKVVSQSAY